MNLNFQVTDYFKFFCGMEAVLNLQFVFDRYMVLVSALCACYALLAAACSLVRCFVSKAWIFFVSDQVWFFWFTLCSIHKTGKQALNLETSTYNAFFFLKKKRKFIWRNWNKYFIKSCSTNWVRHSYFQELISNSLYFFFVFF